ncbi:hypothetical protein M8C21_021139, partial [Ambrosia artemisiifolia]
IRLFTSRFRERTPNTLYSIQLTEHHHEEKRVFSPLNHVIQILIDISYSVYISFRSGYLIRGNCTDNVKSHGWCLKSINIGV